MLWYVRSSQISKEIRQVIISMKFFALLTQHSNMEVQIEGWGKGLGLWDWGTLKTMGVPSNEIFIYLFIFMEWGY